MSNVTKYVRDAFKSLDLLEDTEFELDSKEDFEELDDFINVDGDIPEKEVIDLEAETEEEVKDSYIGEVILECPVCHSDHFDSFEKAQDYIETYKEEHDGEEPELCFEGEACPVCGNEDGFKIIGKVAPFELEDEEDDEVEVETDDEYAEVEVKEKEEVKEALKRKVRKSLKESKKLKEGYTFEPGYHEWILWKDGDAVKSLGDITVDLPEVCNKDNLRQYAEDLTDQIFWNDEDGNVDIVSLKADKNAIEDAIFTGLFAQYGEVVESKKSSKGKKLNERFEEYKVVDKSGKEIKDGDEIVSFRGEKYTFQGITKAPGGGSTGKIYAQEIEHGWSREFYPSVFDLEIVERDGSFGESHKSRKGKKLKESVSVSDIKKFLEDSIKAIKEDPSVTARYVLDDDLCLYVGYEGGFDEDETGNDERICAKIAERNDFYWVDFEAMNMPWDPDTGDVWDTDSEVDPSDADWYAKEYKEIRKALDNGEVVLESRKSSKGKKLTEEVSGVSHDDVVDILGIEEDNVDPGWVRTVVREFNELVDEGNPKDNIWLADDFGIYVNGEIVDKSRNLIVVKESKQSGKGRKLKEATSIKGLENAKNVAEEFKNYAAYKANFKPLVITKQGKDYFVYKEGAETWEDHTTHGTKEYVEGWMEGAIKAKHKRLESIKHKSKKKLKETKLSKNDMENFDIVDYYENNREVPDLAYEMASEISDRFSNQKEVTWGEFNTAFEEAYPGVIDWTEDAFNELENDVRGVLNQYGWATVYEGENEGGLTVESRKSGKGKKLTEAPVYELRPQYDNRQSFYGKAQVDTGDKNDKNKLYSYGTLVAEIKDGKPVVYGTYSQTTLRHIKDWLKQNGFKAETSKQIITDYGIKEDLEPERKKPMSRREFENTYKLDDGSGHELKPSASKEEIDADYQKYLKDFNGEESLEKHAVKESALRKFRENRKVKEDIERAEIETSDQVISISSEPKEEDFDANADWFEQDGGELLPSDGEEMIAPLSDEEVSELAGDSEEETAEGEEEVIDEFPEDEEEFEFDEVQEESFNRLVGNYLNNVYSNAKSFKLKEAKSIDGQLKITGTIDFKSGKSKDTTFIFEKVANRKSIAKNKARFVGLNETFTDKKNAYVLRASIKDKKLVAESLRYDYPAKGKLNESVKTVKGLVK